MDAKDIRAMLGGGAIDAMPEQLQMLVAGLIEGRIRQMVVVFETDDGNFMDCYPIIENSATRLAMLGALDVVKRDYMRTHLASRIEYVEREE